MQGGSAGNECGYVRLIAEERLEVILKGIDVGAEGGYPVGVESLLDERLFLPAHVGEGKPDTIIVHYKEFF
jgi:hypothetical protein